MSADRGEFRQKYRKSVQIVSASTENVAICPQSGPTFKKTVLLFHYKVAKGAQQSVADIPFKNFGTRDEQRNRALIIGKSVIATFVNGKPGKMIFFKALVENQREGKGNVFTGFNKNEVWKTVQTIAYIGVNVANEKRLDYEKSREGDGTGQATFNHGRDDEEAEGT